MITRSVCLCNWLIGFLLLGGIVSIMGGYRLNLSPSVPCGVYRLRPVPAHVTPGMLVLLPVPAPVRPVVVSRAPLQKPVAGVTGDTVCVTEIVTVNGRAYGPVKLVSGHLPLPRPLYGCTVIRPGEVFLASSVPGSVDSRYFGPVPVAQLTYLAVPVWIW